jgi:hypothetical protein
MLCSLEGEKLAAPLLRLYINNISGSRIAEYILVSTIEEAISARWHVFRDFVFRPIEVYCERRVSQLIVYTFEGEDFSTPLLSLYIDDIFGSRIVEWVMISIIKEVISAHRLVF